MKALQKKGLGPPSGESDEQITTNDGQGSAIDCTLPDADDGEIDYYNPMNENEELALALRLSAFHEDSLHEAKARGETGQQSADLGTVREDGGSSVPPEKESQSKDKSSPS